MCKDSAIKLVCCQNIVFISLWKTIRIANKSLHIKELKSNFVLGKVFTVQDITKFYEQFEEGIKRSTIDWRIYELTQRGILYRIERGIYSLSENEATQFIPEVSGPLKNLSGKLNKQFPFIDICLWSTKWLNEFMLHQPGWFYTILEVEIDAMESVFYALKEKGKDVFIDPSEEILNKYVSNTIDPIIITRLITEAPTRKIHDVVTPTLEKMLVDIFCDQTVFATYQGAELNRIYQTAIEKYNMSRAKMMRYANRRNKKFELQELIKVVMTEGQ